MPQYSFERLQPEYAGLWQRMIVTKTGDARAVARRILAGKSRYKAVEDNIGVPWFVVGLLHDREATCRFDRWLHNGDPMRDKQGHACRTVHVPANRPPDPTVTWEEGAADALVECKHFDEIRDWCPEQVAYVSETMNGFGYRSPTRNIPSPYLWGGTNLQKPGKFVADHDYRTKDDSGKPLYDQQIGTMAVLKTLMDMDADVRFGLPVGDEPDAPEAEPEAPADLPPPQSPYAGDKEGNVKPLSRSRTILGGLFSYVTATVSAIAAFFDKLDNVYTLTAFIVLLLVAAFGLWLVFSGRLRAQEMIKHLCEE